jgi:hypothetical protein
VKCTAEKPLDSGAYTHRWARAPTRGLVTAVPLALTCCATSPGPSCARSRAACASLGAVQRGEAERVRNEP